MLLGDFISLVLNIGVFHFLYAHFGPANFAVWEWNTLLLGLCLLLPRNGLDIIAFRSSVRHPSHLGHWVGLTLFVRALMCIIAIPTFLLASNFNSVVHRSTLLPLALTLLLSSFSPDLGARVHGRFRKAGFLVAVRNATFLIFLNLANLFLPVTFQNAGWLVFASELSVCLLWWADAWSYQVLPSMKFMSLLRRAWRPILLYTMEQSGVRFLRVFSWSLDALVLGALFHDNWADIAPARRFLMTAVIPTAGWLGVVGPTMASRNRREIRIWTNGMIKMLISVTFCSVSGALMFGPFVFETLIGPGSATTPIILALNAIRLLPMIGFQLLSTECTALRHDQGSLRLIITHIAAQCVGITIGFMARSSIQMQLVLVLSETFVFGLVLIRHSVVLKIAANNIVQLPWSVKKIHRHLADYQLKSRQLACRSQRESLQMQPEVTHES